MKKISVIFPLFNEEARLNKLFRKIVKFNRSKNKKHYEFIFVDDGSTDDTVQKILNFIQTIKGGKNKFKLIKSSKNFGKGHALKLGVKNSSYSWIFTMDADLSVDLFQINKWIKKYTFKDNEAYFGSRNHPESLIKFKFYRKIIGQILRMLVFLFIDEKIKDTQCGFKFYNKKYIKKVFNSLKEKGFAHDIELIFLLKKNNIKIIELPIKWVHMENSKLNPLSESIVFFIKFFILITKYKFLKIK